jgi:hypothetical protein
MPSLLPASTGEQQFRQESLMKEPREMNAVATAHAGVTLAGSPPIGPLMRDLLAWLARTPRTYAETMEAWRSSCPRLTIWEDALADGLVRVESGHGTRLSEAPVVLTLRGHATLG